MTIKLLNNNNLQILCKTNIVFLLKIMEEITLGILESRAY